MDFLISVSLLGLLLVFALLTRARRAPKGYFLIKQARRKELFGIEDEAVAMLVQRRYESKSFRRRLFRRVIPTLLRDQSLLRIGNSPKPQHANEVSSAELTEFRRRLELLLRHTQFCALRPRYWFTIGGLLTTVEPHSDRIVCGVERWIVRMPLWRFAVIDFLLTRYCQCIAYGCLDWDWREDVPLWVFLKLEFQAHVISPYSLLLFTSFLATIIFPLLSQL